MTWCWFYRDKDTSAFDLSKNALTGHTKRIFKQIGSRSKRDIQQFTFGTTYVQLNPNFRKFERMDPLTWKKEGISSVWTGVRGYRRNCCKNCCIDLECEVTIKQDLIHNKLLYHKPANWCMNGRGQREFRLQRGATNVQ